MANQHRSSRSKIYFSVIALVCLLFLAANAQTPGQVINVTCAPDAWLKDIIPGQTPVCTQPNYANLAGVLPNPAPGKLGGVFSQTCPTGEVMTGVASNGLAICGTASESSLSATSPVLYNPSTQVISFLAGSSANDVLTWNGTAWHSAPVSGGSVTSVGLSLPNIFTVTNSPVTSSGTLTGTFASQLQNLIFASPNGSTGPPTFRSLVSSDIPALAYANKSLSNLTSPTSINQSLLFDTDNVYNIGSPTNRPRFSYIQFFNNAADNTIIDLSGPQLADELEDPAMTFSSTNRALFYDGASGNAVAIDYLNAFMQDNAGTTALIWQPNQRQLVDNTSQPALDWNTRQLIDENNAPVSTWSSTGLSMISHKITSLATPTTGTDAANKSYVDAHGIGGLSTVRIVTTTTSIVSTDKYVVGNSSSAINFNLPAATTDGQVYIFKNKNTGTVSVVPNGTDTIDGVNTSISMVQNVSYSLFSAGGAWYIW